MKKLILTALNNNDDIWFDCFIPFIITLKGTNYKGEVGVISYHLSEEKKLRLLENNILVFEALNLCPDLSLDRFLSAAHIAENYDLVALYDADIWFPKPELTVFEQIKDSDYLYCCYDVILPPFLLNGVLNTEEIALQLEKLLTIQSYYWQAGLTIAHNIAWKKYASYLIEALQNGNYKFEYGIDTTLLNLYSAQKNNVKHLAEKYNCLPFWGIQVDKSNFFPLKINNEEIEGIHITRFHRETNDFSFLKIASDIYLNNGTNYSLNRSPLYHYQHCGHLFQNTQIQNSNSFYCSELFCHTASFKLLDEILTIDAKDTFEIKLSYAGKTPCQIRIGYQAILNTHLPINFNVYLNNKRMALTKDKMTIFKIQENDELLIQSLHIRGDFGIRILLDKINIINE